MEILQVAVTDSGLSAVDVKIWILLGIVSALGVVVWYLIKQGIAYIKGELVTLSDSVNNHSLEMSKNTQQLISLFKLFNRLDKDNDSYDKRIRKLEVKQQVMESNCNTKHKGK